MYIHVTRSITRKMLNILYDKRHTSYLTITSLLNRENYGLQQTKPQLQIGIFYGFCQILNRIIRSTPTFDLDDQDTDPADQNCYVTINSFIRKNRSPSHKMRYRFRTMVKQTYTRHISNGKTRVETVLTCISYTEYKRK